MVLDDGSWLRLEIKMLRLFPGTSTREEQVWFRGTPVEEIVTVVG
jgi:hypothetical protein